jgi:hypothetical protein
MLDPATCKLSSSDGWYQQQRVLLLQNFCLDAAGSNDTIKIIDFGFARMAYGEYTRWQ